MNKQAFTWGRLAAHDIARVRSVTQFRARAATTTRTLDESIAYRADFLTEYQSQSYAERYRSTVAKVRSAETKAAPGSNELTEAVAKNLFKLMAYKDEYEVARLYTDDSFTRKLGERFEGDVRLRFHLAPPLLARRDKATGHLQKKEYGGWMIHAFRLLARLKFLRGTAFDPFGYTAERKTERKLIDDYLAMVEQRIATLKGEHIPTLARLARLPEMIRGYGHIKQQSVDKFFAEKARLAADIENQRFAAAAAE
jgi:indolepyruvate ferredoxin oxidoreductase